MFNKITYSLHKCYFVCVLISIFSFLNYAFATEEPSITITEESIKAMMEKATPLIEEVTGRKYKNNMEWKIVKRDIVRDVLIQELFPQLKKLLKGFGDDMLTRQAEMTAQIASQSLLGKYSFLKKEFYIIPDNVKTVVEMLEIKDEQIDDFIFLVVTHEMVHVLDDQYFDIQEKMKSRDNVENSGAFNALMEGHAVYVTNKVADILNISETSRQLSVKSAAGIQGKANRQQQQLFHSIYVKGSEFVEAIIDKKGPSAVTAAFASPPVSTRQIMIPDEYLNPPSVASIDFSKILQKVAGELPIEGMRSQELAIGSMILRTILISEGVPENDASAVSDNCLNGTLFLAIKQLVKPSEVTVAILNFSSGEAVSRFVELEDKIEKSEMAQINAKLNASYNLVKEEVMKLDGFDFVKYRHSEKKIDEDVTTKLLSIGIIENMYVEVGFENVEEVTEDDVLNIMGLINTEQLKLRQESKQI